MRFGQELFGGGGEVAEGHGQEWRELLQASRFVFEDGRCGFGKVARLTQNSGERADVFLAICAHSSLKADQEVRSGYVARYTPLFG